MCRATICRLTAEEQPQENDHRDRHAKQPEQKSASHLKPPRFLVRRDNAEGQRRFLLPGTYYYQWPVFGIELHGSAGGLGSPFCNNSIECRSGERTKAMLPSRGGRLMVIPCFISLSQVA
jgi:hypothetical protein